MSLVELQFNQIPQQQPKCPTLADKAIWIPQIKGVPAEQTIKYAFLQ